MKDSVCDAGSVQKREAADEPETQEEADGGKKRPQLHGELRFHVHLTSAGRVAEAGQHHPHAPARAGGWGTPGLAAEGAHAENNSDVLLCREGIRRSGD